MVANNTKTKTIQRRIIYGVALVSVIESLTFVILYGWLISELGQTLRYVDHDSPTGVIHNSTRNMAATMVAVSGLRLFIALALLMKSYKTIMTFYIATQAGILVNLSTGFIGTYSLETYGIGLATLCVIGLHIVYVTVIHRVIKSMRTELFNKVQSMRRIPCSRPATRNVFTLPTGNKTQHQVEHTEGPPPYSVDANIDLGAPPSYDEAPPIYVSKFGNSLDKSSGD